MKKSYWIVLLLAGLGASLIGLPSAHAKFDIGEVTERTSEKQIRNLVEPLLDKYCREECKLLSVNVNVDLANSDDTAPGFDDIDPKQRDALAPSYAKVKLLIDQKLGATPRAHMLELIQQYLDTLDYPVKVETVVTQFPQPTASSARVAEMREKIIKQFRAAMSELFQQFCPEQCMLGDLDLKTELVNVEEAQYGSSGEFFQDGDIAIRVRDLSATLLLDDTLGTEERANLIEMAKLKSNFLKDVTLNPKVLRFPHGLKTGTLAEGEVAYGPGGLIAGKSSTTDSKLNSSSTSNNNSSNSVNSKNSTLEKSEAHSNTNSNSNSTNSNNSKSTNNSNTNSNNTNSANNSENNTKQERFERFEKIERVENGDALQKELEKFKVYGLVFACSVLSLLIFLAVASLRPRKGGGESVQRLIQSYVPNDDHGAQSHAHAPSESSTSTPISNDERLVKRYEIERIKDELMQVFANAPKVAKYVFSKVLVEDGVEVTAHYIHMLGENVVLDMLRDPSLQSDMAELMDFYAKNTFNIDDDERLALLQRLHNRTVSGKLAVYGNRSSTQFDFLAEMDGLQILEMVRTESLTVKAMVLTQCDPTKRAAIYAQLDEQTRMAILAELSRIDYLPRDYIYNVSNALKRKRKENPKLNTEALPGSEVLVSLLERTGPNLQRTVVRNLEASNPDSARVVKGKLVCLDTLRFLRDSQLLEVVLSLKHDELLMFLKGCPPEVRVSVFSKSPKELIAELEEELAQVGTVSRETYQAIERKILNRMKIMANEGLINLIETNERMFAETRSESTGFIQAGPPGNEGTGTGLGYGQGQRQAG